MKISSNANSRVERSSSVSPRQARCAAGSSLRSPTSKTVGRSTGPRRAKIGAAEQRPEPRRRRIHDLPVRDLDLRDRRLAAMVLVDQRLALLRVMRDLPEL
jgi:hypothetical protein